MNTPYGEAVDSTWYTFDPNVHYYYDEHSQIHYYDPNTNQDISYHPQHYYPNNNKVYTPTQSIQSAYTEHSSRQPTPDVLLPCPEPTCEGENKPKSKFCEECGRPLGAISRSVTPAISSTPPPTSLNSHSNLTLPNLTKSFSQHQLQEVTPNYYSYQTSSPQPYTNLPQQAIQRPPTAPVYSVESTPNLYQSVPKVDPRSYYNGVQHQSMQDLYGLNQDQTQTYQPPSQHKDILTRARGCPLISFGFGGKIITTFPRSVTNYYSSINKSQPGPIKITSLKSILPSTTPFPGPVLFDSKMSTKQKKKEVIRYLAQKISDSEITLSSIPVDSTHHTSLQSNILLLKILRVLMENEGHINDKGKMDSAILDILRPAQLKEDDLFTLPAQTTDPSDMILSKMESILLQGNRQGAVDYAMQEDLWSHALIISSCVDKDLWQKVVSQFVQREMNATPEMKLNRHYNHIAGHNQPLRVLYSLFSGAGGGAMNEFMDNTSSSQAVSYGPVKQKVQAKDLVKWRDTVAIILANRTGRDQEALTALGDLLNNTGWTEAAHICYLLSPQIAMQSGIDTVHVRLTLLGDNQPTEESIGLTEILEFAHSLHNPTPMCLPYLQGYKLIHAWMLADYGYLDEAQRYHEAIEQSITSYTKPNPYLHQCLTDQLSILGQFLENAIGKKAG
ncbi:Sec23-binding domain of Sec16-domain-containing protein [Pilobolus umbonatus]|nr:Sec23-binding domain of Sec16-domain-containing protein [Pilobolus umbonatus]